MTHGEPVNQDVDDPPAGPVDVHQALRSVQRVEHPVRLVPLPGEERRDRRGRAPTSHEVDVVVRAGEWRSACARAARPDGHPAEQPKHDPLSVGRVDQPESFVGRLRQRRPWFRDGLVHNRSVTAGLIARRRPAGSPARIRKPGHPGFLAIWSRYSPVAGRGCIRRASSTTGTAAFGVALRRVLPLLLAPERRHVEIGPGGAHRLVAAAVDEVGAEHADQMPEPLSVGRCAQAMLAHVAGRFDEAERRHAEACAQMARHGSLHADGIDTLATVTIRASQHRVADYAPAVQELDTRFGPLAADARAVVLAAAGRPDAARAVLDGAPPLRPDFYLSIFATLRAMAVVAVGQREPAEELYAALLPIRGQLAGAASTSLAMRRWRTPSPSWRGCSA